MSRSLISITPLRRGYIIPSKRTSSTAEPYKFLPFKENAELHRISPRFLLYPQGYHLNQREHHMARPINRSRLHNPCLHEAWAVVGGSVQTWDCMDTTWKQDGMHNQGKSNECIGNMCKTSDSIKIEHIICRLIHLWWCNNATQTKSVETCRLVQWVAPAHTFFYLPGIHPLLAIRNLQTSCFLDIHEWSWENVYCTWSSKYTHMITALSSLSVVRTSGEKPRHLPNIHLALKKSAKDISNFGFLRYSTVESEFVIWIFVWKSSETHDTSPGVVTEVPVADIHQLDDPNDVIPRQGQLQIVTCLK